MIEARNLTKEYKGQRVLDNVSFNIAKGELFCLIGANGAGKSTTIKIFINQLKQYGGSAIINSADVSLGFTNIKPIIAYVPENMILYGHLTGIENLDFFCSISGLTYSRAELESYLIKAGLEEKHFNKKMRNYSKGMRQKTGIAFALAKKAKVLFLDEPTSGLDPKSIVDFSLLIRTLKMEGMTILMTSHDLFRTINDADKIGIMREGRLLEIVDARQITHAQLEEKYIAYMNQNV